MGESMMWYKTFPLMFGVVTIFVYDLSHLFTLANDNIIRELDDEEIDNAFGGILPLH